MARADSAFAQANLAFDAANNVAPQIQPTRDVANSAFAQANLAFNKANSGFDLATSSFAQANLAYDGANSAFIHANNAFAAANSKISSSGGTIFGDLSVTGNLTITGNTTTINVSSLAITDTIIQLGIENLNDTLDIGFIGHYANTPNNHTGLVRSAFDGKYYLFDNYQIDEPGNAINFANTGVATLSANLVTNVITLRGVDPLDYANTIQTASQANVGAGLITVTNAYEANVGAGLITKVAKAGDTMTGTLSTSGTLIGSSLTSNNIVTVNTHSVYEATAVTTGSTAQFTLDSFSTTDFRSAKYLVQITSGSSYELLEMTLIHDGTTVYLSQYGNIKTGATLGVFDATISSGTLSVLATPTNAITTFKSAATLIPI